MSMISEQVRELKDYANFVAISKNEGNMILRAADTIEALSTKLQAANTENVGGWIACSERLPEYGKRYLVTAVWVDGDFEKKSVYDAVYGSDGIWHTHNYEPVSYKVLAWHPLPEPYKPQERS